MMNSQPTDGTHKTFQPETPPAVKAWSLPPTYKPAAWRNTLAHAAQPAIGIGFDLKTGEVLRLAIDERSARQLAETLAGYLLRRGIGFTPDTTGLAGEPFRDAGDANEADEKFKRRLLDLLAADSAFAARVTTLLIEGAKR